MAQNPWRKPQTPGVVNPWRRAQATQPGEDAEEARFRAWYGGWAKKAGIDPDPDNPLHKYDYRAAYRAGAVPQIDPSDSLYHWPSEFKADDHPNRYVNGVDTKRTTPTAAKRPGVVGGVLRTGLQGISFGTTDEMRGIAGGIKSAATGEGWTKGYTTERDKEREYLKGFREDHPVLSTGAEIAGGLVVPGAAAFRAAKGVKTAAQSAGAISKALKARKGLAMAKAAVPAAAAYSFGAAEGTPGEQALQTAGGTLLGAGLAPAIPAAMGGVTKVARKVFPKGRTAAAEASERVLAEMIRDQKTPQTAMKEIGEAAAAGVDDLAPADLGPNLRGAFDWAASTPGKGMAAAQEWAERREASMKRILRGAYQKLAGRTAVSPVAEARALRDASKAAGREAFEPIFETAAAQGPITDPALVTAIKQAASVAPGAKRLAKAWGVPAHQLVQVGEEGVKLPTWRYAHYVKMNLQGQANAAKRAGNDALAGGLTRQADQIRTLLVSALPGYDDALAQHASYMQRIAAMKRGMQILTPTEDAAALADDLAKMAPEVAEAYKLGADAAIRRKIGTGLGARESTAWWADEEMQRKLALVLDEDQLPQFNLANRVTRSKKLTNAAGFGSPTAPRAMRDEEMGMSAWSLLRHPKRSVAAGMEVLKQQMDRRAKERVGGEMVPWLTDASKLGDLDLLAQSILLEQIRREALARGTAAGVTGGRR